MGVDCYLVSDNCEWIALGRAYQTEDAPTGHHDGTLDLLNSMDGAPAQSVEDLGRAWLRRHQEDDDESACWRDRNMVLFARQFYGQRLRRVRDDQVQEQMKSWMDDDKEALFTDDELLAIDGTCPRCGHGPENSQKGVA